MQHTFAFSQPARMVVQVADRLEEIPGAYYAIALDELQPAGVEPGDRVRTEDGRGAQWWYTVRCYTDDGRASYTVRKII